MENILTDEELKESEAFHNLMNDNMWKYISWYSFDEDGSMKSSIGAKTIEKINQLAETSSLNVIHSVGYYGMTIFHQLVTGNYYDAVKKLLERGANPNVCGKAGKDRYEESYIGVTPLHLACFAGNLKMFKLLLEYGADDMLTDNKGRNCFHYIGGAERIYSYRDSDNQENALQAAEIARLLKCDINHKDNDGITPFINLIKYGQKFSLTLTPVYLELGADVHAKDENENTVLMLAVKKEKHITDTCILSKYKDLVNMTNKDGDTALHIAMREYNFRAMYTLLRHGADYKICNKAGENPLEMLRNESSYKEGYKVFLIFEKIFLNKRLRLDDYFDLWGRFDDCFWGSGYSDGNTFFYEFGREIAKKIDMDDETEHEYVINLVENFLQSDQTGYVVEILYEEGFDLCEKLVERHKVTTIRDICCENAKYNNINALKRITSLGVNMNTAVVDGKTPAFLIVEKCKNCGDYIYEECIKALEYCSVESMEQLCNEGVSALHKVAEQGNHAMLMEYMIKRGVNVNITTDVPALAGETALHIACRDNNYEVVKALKNAGADDSIININSEVPAYCLFDHYRYYSCEKALKILPLLDTVDCSCAETGDMPILRMYRRRQNSDADYEMTEIFIEKGIDVNKRDNNGNTALLVQGDNNNNKDVIKLLLSEGAELNARNKNGDSVLMYVIKKSNVELARYLIKKGADYNIINMKNETPASICIKEGMEMVLELMTNIKVVPTMENYDDDEDYDDYDDDEYDE